MKRIFVIRLDNIILNLFVFLFLYFLEKYFFHKPLSSNAYLTIGFILGLFLPPFKSYLFPDLDISTATTDETSNGQD